MNCLHPRWAERQDGEYTVCTECSARWLPPISKEREDRAVKKAEERRAIWIKANT